MDISKRSLVWGVLTAVSCAALGGLLVAKENAASGLGVSMFLMVPVATGTVTAFTVPYWSAVATSLLIGMTLCLAGLVFVGLEGIVCVAMAFPIILIGSALGAGMGILLRRVFSSDRTYSVAIVPLLAAMSVVGSREIENQLAPPLRVESFETTLTIDAPRNVVWDAMLKFDEVDGPQPLLMHLGLPVPLACTMEGDGPGAQRVCRFNLGTIEERVTRWEPPHRLELDVEKVDLPGRHWLGFQTAAYRLEESGGRTRVTRSTTVTSTLRPAFYWRYFERMGVEAEHDYILASLARKAVARSK
ncbi:MAG: SRPBCC family protein [Planctomycetales bacterium]|nr:SRPBCC family protein [Planctomycetales bacterium]